MALGAEIKRKNGVYEKVCLGKKEHVAERERERETEGKRALQVQLQNTERS